MIYDVDHLLCWFLTDIIIDFNVDFGLTSNIFTNAFFNIDHDENEINFQALKISVNFNFAIKYPSSYI